MQADKSVSYLYHLIVVQQMQRAAVYKLDKLLKRLQEYDIAFERSYSCKQATHDKGDVACSFPGNDDAIVKCLWQQKVINDLICVLPFP